MKTILFLLLTTLLSVLAQSQTLIPNLELPKPYSDTLKPIDFREIPYTYTTSNRYTYRGQSRVSYSTHTGINRIYSYDGIDVDNPEKELWRYLTAVNDPDVNRLQTEFNDIVARKQTASELGTTIFVPGLAMLVIGAVQAAAYKDAVSKQQKASYTTTTSYTPATPSQPSGPNLFNCSSWIGSGSKWTCLSGPYAGQSVTTDPFGPTPVQTPVSQPVSTPTYSNTPTINQPTGVGLGVAGGITMLVGMIVMVSAPGDQHSTFLKAVQYYNRALKQKFSWEMKPYATFSHSGLCIIGHF